MNDFKEFKEIEYNGAKILVNRNGDIIWNGKKRNRNKNKDGYLVCSIKTNKGWRNIGVHILVATAFIPNPNNLPEINHKDFNRENPKVDNLEWCTRQYNVKYSLCNRHKKYGADNPNYNNHKLSNIYKNNKELALEKQSRKGGKNGRCVKIKLYYDKKYICTFDYIGQCCEYLINMYNMDTNINSIRIQIQKSIKQKRPYKKHFTFEKI